MRELRATFWEFWMGSGRSVWACPRRGRGGGRGEWRGGAPMSTRGRRLAGQLREDEVELKAGSVQAVARAWRAKGMPGRERSRGGRGRRRRVDMCSSWRWRCGGGEAAARGAALPAAGEQSRDPRARGGRREGRGPGDWFVISNKCRDLSVN
jgi:hypothetical protein